MNFPQFVCDFECKKRGFFLFAAQGTFCVNDLSILEKVFFSNKVFQFNDCKFED